MIHFVTADSLKCLPLNLTKRLLVKSDQIDCDYGGGQGREWQDGRKRSWKYSVDL